MFVDFRSANLGHVRERERYRYSEREREGETFHSGFPLIAYYCDANNETVEACRVEFATQNRNSLIVESERLLLGGRILAKTSRLIIGQNRGFLAADVLRFLCY